MELDFAEVLLEVVERRASDLHLTAGAPPMVRVRGRLTPMEGYPVLTPTDTREIVYSILSNSQRQKLENNWQLDFAYQIPGAARFRVNAYFQRSALGAAFRLIPFEIAPLETLGLPAVVADFAKKPRGLVLVTGPTGSGKSTTLASLIDVINESREEHIMTIEDPIEFLHNHKKCMVNQRELGADATSFADALKAALRQDPDVILVGEMRDLETIGTAITAAETGHLVFATLHTQDTPQTIDRIIDVFPSAQQGQIRAQLSVALQGIMTQTLLPTADGSGRCCAVRGARPDARRAQPHPRGEEPPDLLGAPDRRPARHADDGRLARAARARGQDHPPARRVTGALGRGVQASDLRRHARPVRRIQRRRDEGRVGAPAWPPSSSKRWTSPAFPPEERSRQTPSRTSPSSSKSAA